ncbi:MAG: MFS transporter [Rhodospirillales bacterium]|nr:MFS transporter [Rhodospirillales bacterium]
MRAVIRPNRREHDAAHVPMPDPAPRTAGPSPRFRRMAAPVKPRVGAAHAGREAMPVWPLLATLAVQTLATMALFSLPAAAPDVARTLHVHGALIGVFVSLVYGVGIVSAVFSPGFIHRYGAVRVTQIVLASVVAMLLIAGLWGSLAALAVAAVVLGLGYGATASASTHLLVPHTPKSVFNTIMSLRQIGVPLGGIVGALVVPPIVVAAGWRVALLAEVPAVLILMLAMEIPRRAWDRGRDPGYRLFSGTLGQQYALLRADARLRRLAFASFILSGTQLCFIAFMTVHLTSRVGLGLVEAGQALALYQIASAASRPVWGWVADRLMRPERTLALLGFAAAASALAAGQFGPSWPLAAILAVALLAGMTAGGFTGVAYAEYAHLGGARRTEATSLGTGVMFAAVMIIPSAFGAVLARSGSFTLPYALLAAGAVLAGLAMLLPARPPTPGGGAGPA